MQPRHWNSSAVLVRLRRFSTTQHVRERRFTRNTRPFPDLLPAFICRPCCRSTITWRRRGRPKYLALALNLLAAIVLPKSRATSKSHEACAEYGTQSPSTLKNHEPSKSKPTSCRLSSPAPVETTEHEGFTAGHSWNRRPGRLALEQQLALACRDLPRSQHLCLLVGIASF